MEDSKEIPLLIYGLIAFLILVMVSGGTVFML
jgi:hypothetical protein